MSFDGILGERRSPLQEKPYAQPISSAGEVLRETYRETRETNPLEALRRQGELDAARALGKPVAADVARSRIREAGLEGRLTAPDQGITQEALDILIDRKRTEVKRAEVFANSPGGFGLTAAQLGVGFGASLLDPINIASGFVPVVGQARYARWLSGARGLAGRSAIRAGVGALEGTVGAALVEPIIYSSKTAEQADYSASDSLLNIAFGTVFGGGLHVVGGAGLDAYRAMRGAPVVVPDQRAPLTAGADMEPMARAPEAGAVVESVEPVLALRRGEIEPNGAYFSTAGASTYFDTRDPGVRRYDISALNIADTSDPAVATAILRKALENETLSEPERARLQEALSEAQAGDPFIDYRLNDELPLPAAAKELGYDGIRVWENDDVGMPSSVFAWGVDKVAEAAEAQSAPARTAAATMDRVRPETREAALRTGVAQAVTAREIDVEPVVNLDPSLARGQQPEAVDAARAAAERNASPEQATLVDFDAAAEVPEPKPRAPILDEAQAALDEALTEAKDVAKAGKEAYKYARAYHGTPTRGIERFSTEFIGKGEGAQAYGWGLYFASKREIAEYYRKSLSDKTFSVSWAFGDEDYVYEPQTKEWIGSETGNELRGADAIAAHALHWGIDLKAEVESASVEGLDSIEINGTYYDVKKAKKAVKILEDKENAVSYRELEGQLYEVDIPEDSEVLDWDKPLSEQPEGVRGAVESLRQKDDEVDARGSDLYLALTNRLGSDRAASEALAALGIKGIKYLDGSSRTAGDGSYNYVVFSGDDVAIRDQFYSRGMAAGATPTEQLTAAVRASFGDATDALLDTGRIKIVDEPAQVPGGPHPEDVRAVYAPDGTTYIVAANMPADMVRGVVLHEVGVHAGMEEMLGADLFARTLGEVDRLIAEGDRAALRARSMVPDDTPAALVREETLAYLVQNAPELPLVRRILAAVKAWIFRVTKGALGELGEDELVSLAESALRRQARGATVMGDVAMASRASIDTPAFKRWFGDSKVVDDNGRPLVVYHGTTQGDVTFAARERGTYFTSNAKMAAGYTSGTFFRPGLQGAVYPVFLSMKNPMIIDALGKRNDNIPFPGEQWKPKTFGNLPANAVSVEEAFRRALAAGHDGLIVRNVVDSSDIQGRDKGDVYVVERPEQIKSATGNVGTFDPANPDIRYSRGPTPAPDPNAELKPFDDAIARAELYAKAVRAAAERIGNDDAARMAMRAATADKLAAEEIEALLSQLKAENTKVRTRLRKAREQFTSEDKADTLQPDAMRAADTLANNLVLDATIAKRNAALALTARTKAVGRILSEFAQNPKEGLMALLGGSQFSRTGAKDSVFHWQRLYFTRWTKGMLADLERAGVAEAFVRNAYDKDVARALYQLGRENPVLENLNPEAVKIAQVVYKYREDARNTRNRYGSWIRELTGYITRQTHDFVKIRAAGAQAWKDFVRPRIDIERTLGPDGGDLDSFLDNVYADFAAGRHLGQIDEEVAAITQPGSLARRVSQSRVLYFKDADGEFEYLSTFGVGKLHEAILTDLSRASQQTGLLRVLGPNPQDTLARVMDEVEESLRGDPKLRRDFYEARGQAEALLTMLDGRANVPGSYTAAKISAGVRAVQAMAKLGGAVISAVTDLPVYASQIRYQGRGGLLSGIGEAVASLAGGRPKGERREILRMIDTVADGMIGGIAARFDADDILSGNTAELMRLYFRYNGLQWWTDTLREGMELGTANWLGNLRGKAYDDLGDEARRTLGMYGIGTREWEVIRQASIEAADKRTYLVPEAMNGVSEDALRAYIEAASRTVTDSGLANARRDLGDRLRNLIIDQAMTAVIEPDVRSRYFWMRGTRPGTFWGEAARFIGQFKGFPTALTRQVFGREIYGRGYNSLGDYLRRGKGDMLGLAQMIVAMTAFGYMAMAAKDLLKGKTPRPPDDPQTWLAAMLQGGAFGIYGDFLLGQSNRFGRNILDTIAGPTLGTIGDLDELRQRAMRGDDVASSAFRLLVSNTPFLNLFYIRTTLDYLILYQIQEALDPGSLRRMERRVEREQGQEFLIAPSEVVN